MDELAMWRCTNCEYLYEPSCSDPDYGIEARTLFGDSPKDWECRSIVLKKICSNCTLKKKIMISISVNDI